MDKLINDVLTYSLISRAEFQNQPVPLGEVVSEVVEQYPQLQSPHAELEVAPLPSVLGHEPSLTQVISNLLTNAVKFVPDGVKPKVKVWAEVQGTSARIWIEDNGIGIEPEYQNKIFGLFERIHPDQKYPGNGIGLSVVRKALERMGGQVGVVSDGVNGSRFWIQMRAAA
ncbi:MAG: sensor histidine kinase [Bellilinea sp.]